MKSAPLLSSLIAAMFLVGCASQQTTIERGWVGGQYAAVRPQKRKHTAREGASGIPRANEGGLLIDRIDPESPIAQAGLRESDLILAVNGVRTVNLKDLQKQIDQSHPGTTATFNVVRGEEQLNKAVVIGRERYRRVRTLNFGISLRTDYHVDLLPNPDFSLIALGYKRNEDRVDMHSPRVKFENPGGSEVPSKEGWRAWLVVFSLGAHKVIVSQEPATATAQNSAAFAGE